jgi:hypothetical protein
VERAEVCFRSLCTYPILTLLTTQLSAALKSTRAHRVGLRTAHLALEKITRRALNELDNATLELRATEGRRRVADGHLERARGGVLGIEYMPPLVDLSGGV